jgi:large subunit ribosomal protein L5
MTTTTEQKKIFEALKGEFGYTNIMQAPKITKVIISSGVGSIKDKKRHAFIAERMARITGQKPAARAAKKSIATFKVREGDAAGYQVTLRGARRDSFLSELINIVYPRVTDFRGLKASAIDEMGNISLGFKEHTMFPETSDEDMRDVFGVGVTIVTTAKDKKEAEALLRYTGLPLKEDK